MLTGDAKKVADQVGAELGIDEIHSELLPADKVAKVEEILSGRDAKSSPSSATASTTRRRFRRADIGIAMGALGSAAAIEAADVVLMDDEPLRRSPRRFGLRAGRLRIVSPEHCVRAIGVKAARASRWARWALANMWARRSLRTWACCVIAVLNAMRALFVENL